MGKTIIMKEEKKDGVDLSFPASEVNRTIVDGHIWGQPWREGSAKKRTRNSFPSCGHDLVQHIIYKSVIKRHSHVCHGILN